MQVFYCRYMRNIWWHINIKKIDKRIFVEKPKSYIKISNFIKNIYNNKIIITPKENILIYKKSYKKSVNIFNKFKNSLL